MANLAKGIPPQPYGKGGRKVVLPVKNGAQIYEGAMVAQISGACVTGTTAGAGACIGVAEHDQLGVTADGTKRISVLTDQIFLMKTGAAAATDATPYGTLLFMEDDNSVGTGGSAGGATRQIAGRFMGLEDDGRTRVYISESGSPEAFGCFTEQVTGTALTDTASTTVQRQGRVTKYLLAGTMSQGETVTLGTTGAVVGDIIRIIRTSTSAQTLAVVNGGAGAGTLCTLVASKIGFAQAYFDGTNWLYDGCSAT